MPALNNAQLEIIKMFRKDQTEEELLELKQLLSEYLAYKLTKGIAEESVKRGYTNEVLNTWKDEHFRTPYK